jgi:uracil phosphoribosyltransferase
MVYELQTPLAKHFINRLRDSRTDASAFRQIVRHLTLLLANEAFHEDDLQTKRLETWLGKAEFHLLDEQQLVFVTVLRAGLPMLEACMELFPQAHAGFLAMARDETTHKATLYYDRVPDCKNRHVVLVDPMVATGGSLCDAIALLQEREPAKVTTLNIIAAPEGLEAVRQSYPGVAMYVAQIDDRLNDEKYILPGLGDAGDRAYNTL